MLNRQCHDVMLLLQQQMSRCTVQDDTGGVGLVVVAAGRR